MSGRKQVLVVDDEVEILQIIRCILEEEGYLVETAPDGKEALSRLSKSIPDLILTDVMMPRLTGYDVLRRVREEKRLSGIPVVLMSCVGPQRAPSDLEWQSFLKKPFTIDELLQTVDVLVRSLPRANEPDPIG